MKSFIEFLHENTLYRGHDYKNPVLGKQQIVWFAFDKSTASEYAKHRDNPAISSIDYQIKKSIDLGNTKNEVTITNLIDKIITGAHTPSLDMRLTETVIEKLKRKFGNSKNSPVHYWNHSDDVAVLVDICGFDSIVITDDGNKTVGVLRKYLT